MTRRVANQRDVAHLRNRTRLRYYYKVGSYFKGCRNCGETVQMGNRTMFLSGHQVMKAYNPKHMGWTHWCYECGAKDEQCWEPAKR